MIYNRTSILSISIGWKPLELFSRLHEYTSWAIEYSTKELLTKLNFYHKITNTKKIYFFLFIRFIFSFYCSSINELINYISYRLCSFLFTLYKRRKEPITTTWWITNKRKKKEKFSNLFKWEKLSKICLFFLLYSTKLI